MKNPSNAVGLVVRPKYALSEGFSLDDLAFLGTCFSFRKKTHFLTAAHCIGDLQMKEIAVYNPISGHIAGAKTIIKHPLSDIAIIELSPISSDFSESFSNYSVRSVLARDFVAFGYPEDVFGEDARIPTQRVFKGHFQRFMDYQSRLGYSYEAAELSIPCPGGLSGGPVFEHSAMALLFGLVTENHQSTTFLHSVEEIQEDGKVLREHYQNIINYGVCLMLHSVKDWLDLHIPKT